MIVIAGTSVTNNICADCPPGTYSDTDSPIDMCIVYQKCKHGVKTNGATSKDQVCNAGLCTIIFV